MERNLMEIHVYRDGERLGPFTLEETMQYFSEGRLVDTDKVWYEGLEDWTLLSEVRDQLASLEPHTEDDDIHIELPEQAGGVLRHARAVRVFLLRWVSRWASAPVAEKAPSDLSQPLQITLSNKLSLIIGVVAAVVLIWAVNSIFHPVRLLQSDTWVLCPFCKQVSLESDAVRAGECVQPISEWDDSRRRRLQLGPCGKPYPEGNWKWTRVWGRKMPAKTLSCVLGRPGSTRRPVSGDFD